MRDHLIFTLAATLGAMGDVAGHERRGSWTWPGRSAILGLLAAASGVRRDGDFADLDALSIAVAVFDPGLPLRDYHTVQTVPSAAVRRPQSRPVALARAGASANTTITLRDYRCDCLYGVAVTGPRLAELAEALERPVFTLYLGRKSCPLAAPVVPKIVSAADAAAALEQLSLPPWRNHAEARTLYDDARGGPADRTETRHDDPLNRTAWHFTSRVVAVRGVSIAPGRAAPGAEDPA